MAVVSLNITGLPNGIAFRTQVQAISAEGIGPVSNHSNAVAARNTSGSVVLIRRWSRLAQPAARAGIRTATSPAAR